MGFAPATREDSMKTFLPTVESIKHKWHVVDADSAVLGRLATRVAILLRGKHKPEYTPHLDTGDGVIVVNAAKVRLTGRKAEQEFIYHHSGYGGGLKAIKKATLLKNKPETLITEAVRGMLPKTKLGRKMATRLKVYAGAEHPHFAQKPEKFDLKK
jgi:large subunit ribosomal protein L13